MPIEGGHIHRVVRGDSLSRIGKLYGVSWLDIARANGIGRPWVIRVGQVLVIPGSARETPPPPSTGRRLYDLQVLEPVRNRHRDPRRRIRWLIVHDPGVTARPAALLSAMRTTASPVSYHRIFSDEARPVVYELVPKGDVAWHAGASTQIPGTDVVNGDVNVFTWSLSIMNPMPMSHWPALVQVLADMVEEAGLPDAGVILAHREVNTARGRRSDPRGIDMDRLRSDVAAELGRRQAA